MTGKGSDPRPMSVARDVYRDNWDRTFGRNGYVWRGEYAMAVTTGVAPDDELSNPDELMVERAAPAIPGGWVVLPNPTPQPAEEYDAKCDCPECGAYGLE